MAQEHLEFEWASQYNLDTDKYDSQTNSSSEPTYFRRPGDADFTKFNVIGSGIHLCAGDADRETFFAREKKI